MFSVECSVANVQWLVLGSKVERRYSIWIYAVFGVHSMHIIHPWCAMLAIYMIFIAHCTLSTAYCLIYLMAAAHHHLPQISISKQWSFQQLQMLSAGCRHIIIICMYDRRAWTKLWTAKPKLYAQTSANQWVNSCTELKLLFWLFFFFLSFSIHSIGYLLLFYVISLLFTLGPAIYRFGLKEMYLWFFLLFVRYYTNSKIRFHATIRFSFNSNKWVHEKQLKSLTIFIYFFIYFD